MCGQVFVSVRVYLCIGILSWTEKPLSYVTLSFSEVTWPWPIKSWLFYVCCNNWDFHLSQKKKTLGYLITASKWIRALTLISKSININMTPYPFLPEQISVLLCSLFLPLMNKVFRTFTQVKEQYRSIKTQVKVLHSKLYLSKRRWDVL